MLRYFKGQLVRLSYILIDIFYLYKKICRAAAMTLRTVLLSLQALLAAAEPDDPQDAVVATQYKDNHPMFELTARHWTSAYAGGNYIIFLKFIEKAIRSLSDTNLQNLSATFNIAVE